MREWIVPAAVLLALVTGAGVLVRGTLESPEIPTFRVTAGPVGPAPEGLVGPRVHTLDASDTERWVYFDFSKGAEVAPSDGDGWDLAFRRFDVVVNGGAGFAGGAGVVDLGSVAFADVEEAPADGYVPSEAARDSVNPAIDRWYDYSFTSHLLTPKSRTYVIRTAEGHFAKLRFLSYYCPGPTPGCVTFEYVYQGGGGRGLAPPD